MTYTVYMLPCGHSNRFMCNAWAMDHGGVNITDYKAVYTGDIEPRETVQETLEAIYVMLNANHPKDYHVRGLSVSDLVSLEDIGTYFCDHIGFKQIN